MSKKVQFSMMVTETQKEIMDFVVETIEDGIYTKAQYVMSRFTDVAKGYCSLPEDYNLTPEMLLSAMKEAKRSKDSIMVGVVGVDNYKQLIQDGIDSGKFSDSDIEYHNSLVDLHLKNTGGKSNE